MKENKELKDLLTTGVIVEVINKTEEEDIKYIGVVVGDIILLLIFEFLLRMIGLMILNMYVNLQNIMLKELWLGLFATEV